MADVSATEVRQRLTAPIELEIATARADGSWRRFVPIWVVGVGDDVYVRTWHRRDTGWFGHAVASGRARVRVPGLQTEVRVEDVGAGSPPTRAAVDAAYRGKYSSFGAATVGRMCSDDAVAATLRLHPDPPETVS